MDRSKPYYEDGDDIIGYWDRLYVDWALSPNWGVFPHKAAWFDERFDHLLPVPPVPQGRVLDWGCGNGMFSTPLLRRYRHYVGWDSSVTALGIAKSYFLGQPRREWAQRDLKLKPPVEYWGSFDLVLSITVLQHQTPQVRLNMIEHIKALLKPGGRYIGLEMIGGTLAYDMPPMPEETWRSAWQPLVIHFDDPPGHPEWAQNNVWYTE